jgi:hypothetical protein
VVVSILAVPFAYFLSALTRLDGSKKKLDLGADSSLTTRRRTLSRREVTCFWTCRLLSFSLFAFVGGRTDGSEKKIDLGADHVVKYKPQDFVKEVK